MGNNIIKYFGETLIDLSGDTVTPEVLVSGYTAHNAAGEPIVGSLVLNFLSLDGGTMNGQINMNSNKITNLSSPTSTSDAANKSYVDNKYTYSTVDLTPGSSALETGKIYLVYE